MARMFRPLPAFAACFLLCCLSAPAGASSPALPALPALAGAGATLAILETTDLHANVLGYDYYKLAPDPSVGLDRTATLIAQARAEFPDSLLFDNGDTLQGSALGEFDARHGVQRDARPRCALPAVYAAMRLLGYDGAGVGNHDFDYGLDYLGRAAGVKGQHCPGPGFPLVLANVVGARTGRPVFAPYAIIPKRVHAFDVHGRPFEATVRVGIIGFTPPTILAWNRRFLAGRVTTTGLVETARRYLPRMRAAGADVVVAISHGGLDGAPYSPTMENGNYHLAQVAGIDALLLGHAHLLFPDPAATNPQFDLPNVDKVRGRVFGVPAVMANLWGRNLGVIRLALRHDGRRWRVDRDASVVETRSTRQDDTIHDNTSYVEPDPRIAALVRDAHAGTIAYVKTPLGSAARRMSTYFADVGDVSAVQPVNAAQADYVQRWLKENAAAKVAAKAPGDATLPVLSLAAPFKSGAAGPGDYTDVAPGSVALNNAADLYPYPNTIAAVKVDGAGLRAWLERAALRFNTIDPERLAPQELVNPAFAGYNFDMATDPALRYEIDVTRPPGSRIRNLAWRGVAVADDQPFLVATNNYRAGGGGKFPGLDGSATVMSAPDTNREVLIAWVRANRTLGGASGARGSNDANDAGAAPARSWRFTPVRTRGPVVFHAPPGKLALAGAAGLDGITSLGDDDGRGKGMALYAIDLARPNVW